MKCFFALSVFLITISAHAHQLLLTPELQEAWKEISRLRMGRAEQMLARERSLRPENMLTDVFSLQLLFQKALATGAQSDAQRFQQEKQKLQQKLSGFNASDPWQQWALGYSGMASLMLRKQAGEQWQIAVEMRRTYTRIIAAYEQYPGFIPNLLTYGMVQIALGSVPEQFSWALRMASLKADSRQGINSLMKVLQLDDNHPFAFMRNDAAIMLGMATRAMQTDKATKNQLIIRMKTLDKSSLLLQYTIAYLLTREGKNDEALSVLNNLPSSSEYLEFPLIDYLLGETMLRKGDIKAASYYQKFISTTQGNMYTADAYRKLGWIALQQGDTALYLAQMTLCRQSGSSQSERDAEAHREAALTLIPHPVLIAARLRFDGGYYTEAQQILEKSAHLFNQANSPYRLEYLYRRARTADGLNNLDEALALYSETYTLGQHSPEYFAANAALRKGEILELRGENNEASVWYNKCLSLRPAVYRSSTHAAARAGLRRLGN
jgi:tetratricopeptide (TPR) repeat protein